MKNTPQPLTDAYHKARRSYCLFSGLLIAWELIGIQLPKDPFPQIKIILKSPEAAPFIFISLILFFSFRMTIEFLQCDQKRIDNKYSKIDFHVAHLLALISVLLFIFQRTTEVQSADVLKLNSFPSILLGVSLSFTTFDYVYNFLIKPRYLVKLKKNLIEETERLKENINESFPQKIFEFKNRNNNEDINNHAKKILDDLEKIKKNNIYKKYSKYSSESSMLSGKLLARNLPIYLVSINSLFFGKFVLELFSAVFFLLIVVFAFLIIIEFHRVFRLSIRVSRLSNRLKELK